MQFSFAAIAALHAVSAQAAPADSTPAVIGQPCQITGIAIAGNSARPTNIDGVCQNVNTCGNVSGINCPGSGQCCFTFDCAGPNSKSACLNP